MQIRVKPGTGIGWQYSSKATIPGIPTKVDRSIFYKDYSSINNANKQEGGNKLTKEQAINALIAVAKNEIGYLEKATNAQLDSKYNLTVDGQAGKNTITKLDSVIAAKENKNFKAFVGACTTNSTPVYQKATGATALATYPILNRGNLVDVVGVSGSRYKIKIANAYTGYIDKNKITTPDKLTTKYPHGVCTGIMNNLYRFEVILNKIKIFLVNKLLIFLT